MSALETVGVVVATATAGVALIGALGAAVVKGVRAGRRTSRFLDQWLGHGEGAERVPGVIERVETLDARTRKIELQVFPNSGGSLRDAVTRLETGFAEHLRMGPGAMERIGDLEQKVRDHHG